MNKLSLLIILHFLTVLSFGQNILPDFDEQPEWFVEKSGLGEDGEIFSEIWYYHYGEYQQLCGQDWLQIIGELEGSNDAHIVGYYREEGQQAWLKKDSNCTTEARLIFDFTLQVSDVFSMPLLIYDNQEVSVDATVISRDTLLDGTIDIHFSVLNGSDEPFETWRSGVGAAQDPFRLLEECYTVNLACERLISTRCLIIDGQPINLWPYIYDNNCSAFSPQRLYVDKDAINGNQTGRNWSNAFLDLQQALAIATEGDEVWVAEGTYFPTQDADRSQSFVIPQGVSVYGGFQGVETLLEERTITTFTTVLSGEIGDSLLRTDNSHHVLTFYGTDTLTILDGFTIEKGYVVQNAGGIVRSGGGALIQTDEAEPICEPRIKNCIFRNNYAVSGGAIAAFGNQTARRAYPRIINCLFEQNEALAYGAGLYLHNMGHPDYGIPLLDGCQFVDNYAGFDGGGFYFEDLNHHLLIRNTEFIRDTALLSGGGIRGSHFGGTNPYIRLENTTFDSCYSTSGASFVFLAYNSFEFPPPENIHGQVDIINCFFKNNIASQEGAGFIMEMSANNYVVNINHSSFEENRVVSQDVGTGISIITTAEGTMNTWVNECKFLNNTHSFPVNGEGALKIGGEFTPSTNIARVTNCVFSSNTKALSLVAGWDGFMRSTVANCTFYNNGIYPIIASWNPNNSDHQVQFFNNIVWEPQATKAIRSGAEGGIEGITIHHSLFSALDCDVAGGDIGCGEAIIIGEDPLFLNTEEYDLRTAACSPARNVGDNGGLDSLALFFDLAGNNRLQENTVDLGAYESPSSLMTINAEVIDASTAESNDGSIQILDILGGAAPYAIQWSNEDTTALIEMLYPGEYQLMLTDTQGCTLDSVFTVSFLNDIENVFEESPFSWKLTNNPSSSDVDCRMYFDDLPTGDYFVDLISPIGQKVQTISFTAKHSFEQVTLNHSSNFQAGNYYLILRNEREKIAVKCWVKM